MLPRTQEGHVQNSQQEWAPICRAGPIKLLFSHICLIFNPTTRSYVLPNLLDLTYVIKSFPLHHLMWSAPFSHMAPTKSILMSFRSPLCGCQGWSPLPTTHVHPLPETAATRASPGQSSLTSSPYRPLPHPKAASPPSPGCP